MNKVALVGRLTKDPQINFSKDKGTPICAFTLAVNRRFKKEGHPEADFINCVCFNKLAENLANYMSKGSQIGILGSIQVESYKKEEQTIYRTNIICEEIEFLGSKMKGEFNNQQQDFSEINDDDCPF